MSDLPEAHGVPCDALLRFLDAAEQRVDALHGMALLRHGRIIARGCWSPYQLDQHHILFSLTKSFTATAIGLAAHEGLLRLDDRLVDLAPDSVPGRISARAADLTVRHLLTMTVGHAEDHTNEIFSAPDQDLIRVFLSLPVDHPPGDHFMYNTGASCVLATLIHRITGQAPVDYLRPRVLEPLGIDHPLWACDANGTSFGGFGLSLTVDEIARFGQLYLDRGMWQGRRILPAEWIEAATARQVPTVNPNGEAQSATGADWNDLGDWQQGYGYHFWRSRHRSYRADGAFGQFCLVFPEQDAVLALTGGVKDMQAVLDLVWTHLLPAMAPGPLPLDADAATRLRHRLASLQLPPAPGAGTMPMMHEIAGRRYQVTGGRPLPVPMPGPMLHRVPLPEWLAVDLTPDGADYQLTFGGPDGPESLRCGLGRWCTTPTVPAALAMAGVRIAARQGEPEPVAASAGWMNEQTLAVRVCLRATPFVTTHLFRFTGDDHQTLTMTAMDNASFFPVDRTTLRARWQPERGEPRQR